MPGEPPPTRVTQPLLDLVSRCAFRNNALLDEATETKRFLRVDQAANEWVESLTPAGVLLTLEAYQAMKGAEAREDGAAVMPRTGKARWIVYVPPEMEGFPGEAVPIDA